jgi:hypothetical protein
MMMRTLSALLVALPLTVHAAMEQVFFCTDGDQGYDLYLASDGRLEATPKGSEQPYLGTYANSVDRVTLSVPGVFEEASIEVDYAKGLYLTMRFPSLSCHTVGHIVGPAYAAYARCPDIKYIPGVSYETNHFQFYENHMVKRRRWKELLGNADTLYRESYGIYLVEGDQVTLFFGDLDDERLLTGKIVDGAGLAIDQLEPGKGVCDIE